MKPNLKKRLNRQFFLRDDNKSCMCGKIMIQSRSRQKKYIILNCNRKRLREKQGTSEEKQMLFSYFTALRNNLATREISESQNKRVKV